MRHKTVFTLIALLCLPPWGLGAWAASVTFNVRSWDDVNKQVVTTTETRDATVLSGRHSDDWIELTNGYYVTSGEVEYQALSITGSDVHLILGDVSKLICKHIKLEQGHSLHIYSQSDGASSMGVLDATVTGEDSDFEGAAAIGGGNEQNSGSLYVYGGYVWAHTVEQKSKCGAAIGGGEDYGIGGEVVVYGGEVYAEASDGAGIGGGAFGSQGGPVVIYGGRVIAVSTMRGAGIGGGNLRDGGSVSIYGGNISVTGSDEKAEVYDVTDYYLSAAIGCGRQGDANVGDIHIYGGTIEAKGGLSRLLSGSLEIADGLMVATNSGSGPVPADQRVETCQSVGNKLTLQILPCTHTGEFAYSSIDRKKHSRVCTYCGFAQEENHTFDNGVCICGYWYSYTLVDVFLYDIQDNNSTLTSNNGQEANVTLFGRTLYRDGSWNTLCLPFDVADIYDTPLASMDGVTVKTLSSSNYDSSTKTLTLNFSDATNSLKAGTPYIIKWNATGDPIRRPRFESVTISSTQGTTVSTDYVDFIGYFSPVSLTGGDKTVLYLGVDNKLYWPAADVTVNACRAVFQLKGITAGELDAGVRRFVLDFGEGEETTEISNTIYTNQTNGAGAWNDLQGRRLNGRPATKGLYINNGKKVAIK